MDGICGPCLELVGTVHCNNVPGSCWGLGLNKRKCECLVEDSVRIFSRTIEYRNNRAAVRGRRRRRTALLKILLNSQKIVRAKVEELDLGYRSCRSHSSSHRGLKPLRRSPKSSRTALWPSIPKPSSTLELLRRLWKKLRRIS